MNGWITLKRAIVAAIGTALVAGLAAVLVGYINAPHMALDAKASENRKLAEKCCDTADKAKSTADVNHAILERLDENMRYFMRRRGVEPVAKPSEIEGDSNAE